MAKKSDNGNTHSSNNSRDDDRKDNHAAKDSHTKDSPGKDSHDKDSHATKDSHGKDSHAKDSHGKGHTDPHRDRGHDDDRHDSGRHGNSGGRPDKDRRDDDHRHGNGHDHDRDDHHDRDHGQSHGHDHGKGHHNGKGHHHGHDHDDSPPSEQNAPPVAADDMAAVAEDVALIASGNLLANDTDADAGDTKAVISVQGSGTSVGFGLAGTYGTLTINGDGSYTYALDNAATAVQALAAGELIVETYSYTVADSAGATSSANLVITITGTNDAPQVAAAVSATTAEDAAAFTVDLLDGASDVDNGETASLSVANVTGLVAGVTLSGTTLTVHPSDASFQHLAVGDSQVITINYDVVDVHGAATPQTATIAIIGTNDAPTVAGALAASANEDDAAFTVDLLAGANDIDDGETATLSVQNVTGLVAGMTVSGATLTIDPAGAAFQQLAAGESQSFTVNYDVVDAQGAATPQLASVIITGTNDAPQVAAAVSASVAEDDASFTVDLLDGASDVDNGETASLSVQNVTGLAAGVTLSGTTLTVHPSDASFQHLAVGDSQAITINYDVVDIHGAATPQTATIIVTGTNDAPKAGPGPSVSVQEDGPTAKFSLLAGASDIDDGETATLTVQNVTGLVGGMTVSGGFLRVDPSDAAFQHLASGDTEVIRVFYDVVDAQGAATPQFATVTVTGTNDAPQVTALSVTAAEDDAAFTVDLLDGAFDPDDGETATLSVVHNFNELPPGITVGKGKTLTVDPSHVVFQSLAAGESQAMGLDYYVIDIHGAHRSLTATITVTGTNDAPRVTAAVSASAAEDGAIVAVDLLAGASDADNGETATLSVQNVTGLVPGMTFKSTTLLVNPSHPGFDSLAAGETQAITVSYDVVDIHGAATPQTATIIITGTNDAPQVTTAVSASVAEDDALVTVDLLAGTSDPDNGETATLHVQNFTGLTPGIKIGKSNTLTVDPSHEAFQHLAVGDSEVITISYDVVDIHGAATPQTATVTVTGTNDAPQVTAGPLAKSFEGTASFSIDLLGGASDPDDGETATLSVQNVTGLVPGMTVKSAALLVNPDHPGFDSLAVGETQTITVSYDVVDIHGAATPQTASITVTGTNDAPIAQDDTFIVDENQMLGGNVLADNSNGPDSDPDSPVLTVTQVNGTSLASGGSITLASGALLMMNADGTFDYDPNGVFDSLYDGQTALDGFTYTLSDGSASATAQAGITVNGIGERPGPDIDVLFANDGKNPLLINQGGAQGGTGGAFSASFPVADDAISQTIALGDLDGDGDLDVLSVDVTFGAQLRLQTNQGGDQGGTEGTFAGSSLGLSSGNDIALGDLDGDGDLDALIARAGTNLQLNNKSGAQAGTEGTFTSSTLPGSAFSNAMALGDVDGDGDLDALVANSGTNQLLTNQGLAPWNTEVSFDASSLDHAAGSQSRDVALGDLDGDGDLDAIFANLGPNELLINQGGAQGGTEGTFIASALDFADTADSWGVALGDIDNDGDLDALIANDGVNQLLINQGGLQGGLQGATEGTFVFAELDGGSLTSNDVALGDIDNDGDLDAIFANSGQNQILTNQGGDQGGMLGSFVASFLSGGAVESFAVALGDVDGDGTAATVDDHGLPNINQAGLLPDMYLTL